MVEEEKEGGKDEEGEKMKGEEEGHKGGKKIEETGKKMIGEEEKVRR